MLILDRLTKDLEDFARKFRELIKKEDPFVSETDLAGMQLRSSSDDGDLTRGMVDRTKRALRNERLIFTQFSYE